MLLPKGAHLTFCCVVRDGVAKLQECHVGSGLVGAIRTVYLFRMARLGLDWVGVWFG